MIPASVPTAKNALFFMTNTAYSTGFLVTFASALISSNLEDFNIYVGHEKNDPIDTIWEAVTQLCERFGFPVERCQRVAVDLEVFREFEVFNNGTYHNYGRVAIAEMLEESTLIYLDSDMIVLDDLSKLLEFVPKEHALAAVQDSAIQTHLDDYYEFVDPNETKDDSPYFNSGFLLINKAKYEELGVFDQLKQLGPRLKNPQSWDQTYLNVIFKNQWAPLSRRWNAFTHLYCPGNLLHENEIAGIMHFVMPEKPWVQAAMNVPHILWVSIAQNVGIQLEPEVLNEYSELARHFKLNEFIELRKQTIDEMIGFFPKLETFKEMLLQNLENYETELSTAQSWLKRNGLIPISEPFKNLLQLVN